MNSDNYVITAGLEAFLRGLAGDPWGKASEEYGKSAHIEAGLTQLASNYQAAGTAATFSFLLMILFVVLWISQHAKYRKRMGRNG